MKIKKMPKQFDAQDFYNKALKFLNDRAEDCKNIYYNTELSAQEKLFYIQHRHNEATGVACLLVELGFEIKDDKDVNFVDQPLQNCFYYEQSAKVDIAREQAKGGA